MRDVGRSHKVGRAKVGTGEFAHEWADVLQDEVGILDEPIVIVMRHEPDPAAARLLVTLGAGWIVDQVHGERCVTQCGRSVCAMSATPHNPPSVIAARLEPAGHALPPFEPNFIDWRTSRGRADRRAEANDETLEICAHCETEIDVAQPAHKPDCRGIGEARASSATSSSRPIGPARVLAKPAPEPEGLDLLERMDAGLPLADDDDESPLEEVAAVGDFTGSGAAGGLSSEPERAATTSSDGNPYGLRKAGRGFDWPKDTVLQALRDYAAEHGRSPSLADLKTKPGHLPSQGVVEKHFGSWAAGLKTAGLQQNPIGARRTAKPVAEIRRAPRAAAAQADGASTPKPTPSQAEREPQDAETDAYPSPGPGVELVAPPAPVIERSPAAVGTDAGSRSADPPPDLRALILAAVAAARTFADTFEQHLGADS